MRLRSQGYFWYVVSGMLFVVEFDLPFPKTIISILVLESMRTCSYRDWARSCVVLQLGHRCQLTLSFAMYTLYLYLDLLDVTKSIYFVPHAPQSCRHCFWRKLPLKRLGSHLIFSHFLGQPTLVILNIKHGMNTIYCTISTDRSVMCHEGLWTEQIWNLS